MGKVMIVQNPDMPQDRTPESDVADLMVMLNSSGWRILAKIMDDNIDIIERQIIRKTDFYSGQPLSDAQADELRFRLSALEDVRTTPQKYIDDVKKRSVIPEVFDPFFRSEREIRTGQVDTSIET